MTSISSNTSGDVFKYVFKLVYAVAYAVEELPALLADVMIPAYSVATASHKVLACCFSEGVSLSSSAISANVDVAVAATVAALEAAVAVSYTHLTLPTNREV